MLARIRKAVIAGLGAGAAAGTAALVQSATEGNINRDEVSKALGLALVSAATVGWATWRIPNGRQLQSGGTVDGPINLPGR